MNNNFLKQKIKKKVIKKNCNRIIPKILTVSPKVNIKRTKVSCDPSFSINFFFKVKLNAFKSISGDWPWTGTVFMEISHFLQVLRSIRPRRLTKLQQKI